MGTGTSPSPGGGVPWAAALVASVNLVPLLWTGVPTSGRQARLRMFPCPGSTTTTTCRVFPDHLITSVGLKCEVS